MNSQKLTASILEPVILAGRRTRANSVLFASILLLPAISCILFGGVDTGTWTLTIAFAAVMMCLWAYDGWQTGAVLIGRSRLPLPLVGLIVLGLVQLPPTPVRSLDPYATRMFVIRLIVHLLFFIAALTFVNTASRVRRAAYFVVIFGAGIGFVSTLQRLADPGTIFGLRETPQSVPFGPYVNQHHFAAMMVLTAGVTFGLLCVRKTSRERRLLLGLAGLVMIVAIAFTSSRGGLIALLLMLMTTFVLSYIHQRSNRERTSVPKYRALVLTASLGLAALTIIFGGLIMLGDDEILRRYIGLGMANGDISNGRYHFWSVAWQIFLGHPIFGAGLDSFGVAFTRFDTWDGTFRVEQAHNDYLQSLADGGVFGLTAVVAFVVLLASRGLRTIQQSVDPTRRGIAIGAFAGCIGILAHSFFDFPLRTPANAFFFLLLAALATVKVEVSD